MSAALAKSGTNIPAALKDAGLAALIALALSVPMLSYETVAFKGNLILENRWVLAAIAVLIVFVGRFTLNLYWNARPGGTDLLKTVGESYATQLAQMGKWVAPLLVLFAVILPFLPTSNRYIMDLAILVMTYVMLGWGLNIVVGLAGLLDLGYVAFYAVGAYSYALIATTFDLSFWVCLPLAGALAALWGIILGFPVLRLRGDYLAIVTLAFGEIIRIVLLNWYSVTNGPDGIT
ncbi:MAG: ABC transporter permease subunit, partial [Methyloligellaceae bacterium]